MKNISVIRSFELIDFDEIMEIEKEAFNDPCSKNLYIYDFQNNPYSEYYKLILEDRIIGFFGLWIIYENAQITTIAVSPKYQGLGYGKTMMNFIINHVKEANCLNITLEVRVTNEIAIKMYKSYGFYEVVSRKNYYENGDDAYLMKFDVL